MDITSCGSKRSVRMCVVGGIVGAVLAHGPAFVVADPVEWTFENVFTSPWDAGTAGVVEFDTPLSLGTFDPGSGLPVPALMQLDGALNFGTRLATMTAIDSFGNQMTATIGQTVVGDNLWQGNIVDASWSFQDPLQEVFNGFSVSGYVGSSGGGFGTFSIGGNQLAFLSVSESGAGGDTQPPAAPLPPAVVSGALMMMGLALGGGRRRRR